MNTIYQTLPDKQSEQLYYFIGKLRATACVIKHLFNPDATMNLDCSNKSSGPMLCIYTNPIEPIDFDS